MANSLTEVRNILTNQAAQLRALADAADAAKAATHGETIDDDVSDFQAAQAVLSAQYSAVANADLSALNNNGAETRASVNGQILEGQRLLDEIAARS